MENNKIQEMFENKKDENNVYDHINKRSKKLFNLLMTKLAKENLEKKEKQEQREKKINETI